MKNFTFRLLFLLVCLWINNPLSAQPDSHTGVCGLHQITQQQNSSFRKSFTDDKEARTIVNWIMSYTGLPPNFIIQAANVPNALATIVLIDSVLTRAILYNPVFMQSVKIAATTDWAPISIIAHEIGHHLSGHTLVAGNNPMLELEADEFSGFVLFKMGATLPAAQAAMRAVASDVPSPSHPGKAARLAAIEKGWKNAQKNDRPAKGTIPIVQKPTPAEEPIATAIFSNVRTQQDLDKGTLVIDVDVSVGGKRNKPQMVTAWFYDHRKQPLRDSNRQYHTSSAFVVTHAFIPTTTSSSFNRRISLEIPIEELHLPSGVHELYIVLGTEGQGTHSIPEKIFVKIPE